MKAQCFLETARLSCVDRYAEAAKVLEDQPGLSEAPPPGQWYYASDSRVSAVAEAKVLQAEAYILFYERIC